MDEASRVETLLQQIDARDSSNNRSEDDDIAVLLSAAAAASQRGVDPNLLRRFVELKKLHQRKTVTNLLMERLSSSMRNHNHNINKEKNHNNNQENESHYHPNFSEMMMDDNELVSPQQQEILANFQIAIQRCNDKIQYLQLQRSVKLNSKQELLKRVDEFRLALQKQKENEDRDVDLDELNHEGDRVEALQQREIELLGQLKATKDESATIAQSIQLQRSKAEPLEKSLIDSMISSMDDDHDNDASTPFSNAIASNLMNRLNELKAENSHSESKLAEYKAMNEFYTGLREVHEELRGVRILRVEESILTTATPTTAADHSTLSNSTTIAAPHAHSPLCIKIVFLLLQTYEMHVDLQVATTTPTRTTGRSHKPPELVPVNAFFRNHLDYNIRLDDLVLTGPLAVTAHAPSSASASSSWDAFVYPNKANRLRRIVTEALARVHLHQQRSQEMDRLRKEQPGIVSVDLFEDTENTGSSSHHNKDSKPTSRTTADDRSVMCRIHLNVQTVSSSSSSTIVPARKPKPWIVVLCLTPEYPEVPGSVYLDQLYQVDVEEEEKGKRDDDHSPSANNTIIEDEILLHQINQQLFSTPMDLMQQLVPRLESVES